MTGTRGAARWVLVAGLLLGACDLEPYPDGVVRCDLSGAACPFDYNCLDPDGDGVRTCESPRCGDGQVVDAESAESCDDANDNELDLCSRCERQTYAVRDAEVIGFGETNADASRTRLGRPSRIAVDRAGNVFANSLVTNRLFRLDRATARLTEYAGTGGVFSVNDDPTRAPNDVSTVLTSGLAVDGQGDVYFADLQTNRVYKIDALTGQVSRAAGLGGVAVDEEETADVGSDRFNDERLATLVSLGNVQGLAIDGESNLFIAERAVGTRQAKISRVDHATGTIRLIFNKTSPLIDATGSWQEELFEPYGIDVDVNGNIYVLDYGNEDVLRISLDEDSGAPSAQRLGLPDECAPRISVEARDLAVTPDGRHLFMVRSRTDANEDPIDNLMRVDLSGDRITCQELVVQTQAESVLREEADGGEDPSTPRLGRIFDVDVWIEDGRERVVFTGTEDGRVWELDPEDLNTLAPLAGFSDKLRFGNGLELIAVDELVLQLDARASVGASTRCSASDSAFGSTSVLGLLEFVFPLPDFNGVGSVSCTAENAAVVAGPNVALFAGERPDAPRLHIAAATRARDCNIYVTDRAHNRVGRIRRDNPTVIETVLPWDAGDAVQDSDRLDRPFGIAGDARGGLLIADSGHDRILRVQVSPICQSDGDCAGSERCVRQTCVADDPEECSRTLTVTELRQNGLQLFMGVPNGSEGSSTPLNNTALREPTAIAALSFYELKKIFADLDDTAAADLLNDDGWALFVNERGANRIRWTLDFIGDTPVDELTVQTLAGSPEGERGDADSDRNGLEARFRDPRTITFGIPELVGNVPKTKLLVMDGIDRLREVSFDIFGSSTVATKTTGGIARDDGAFQTARLHAPSAMAFLDQDHAVVVEGTSGRMRLLDFSDGTVKTATGLLEGREPPFEVGQAEAIPSLQTRPLRAPDAVAFDPSATPGVLYMTSSRESQIWRFFISDPGNPDTWTVDALDIVFPTSSGSVGTGDASRRTVSLSGLAVDAAGDFLYVSDRENHVVWQVPLDESLTARTALVFMGIPGQRGSEGDAASLDDNAPASEALLDEPAGLRLVEDTHLFVADAGNHRVRRVTLSSVEGGVPVGTRVATVLGDGTPSSGSDGGAPRLSTVLAPSGLDIDASGNLFVSSTNVVRLVQSGADGVVSGDDLRETVATAYGRTLNPTGFPEAVTRCIRDVKLRPTQKADEPPKAYVVDSCLGIVIPLERQAFSE